MIRVAVLGEMVAAQLKEGASAGLTDLQQIQIVYSGSSFTDLQRRGPTLSPTVLVLEMDLLGGEPARAVEDLHNGCHAELTIVLYSYARRDLIQQLNGEHTRAMRMPVNLSSLRVNMMSLIVRDLFARDRRGVGVSSTPASASASSTALTPVSVPPATPAPRVESITAPARSFTAAQLGRLQEVRSRVHCECPAQVAGLVASLVAFEDYSKKCQNRDAADAELHASLYAETSRARKIMEDALLALCKHEGIEL